MDHSASARETRTTDLVITGLLSYRLHRVANAFQRSAALLFRREFDVSIGEWRVLALVGGGVANTSNRIARLAGIDPAQMSRIIAKLVDRGLVARSSGPGNSSPLSLTPDLGVRTYEGLMAAARERQAAFLSVLTEEETRHLDATLEKLAARAIGMERAERARLTEDGGSESHERMGAPID